MTRFIGMLALFAVVWNRTYDISKVCLVVSLNISPGAQFLATEGNCETEEMSVLPPRHPTCNAVTGKGKFLLGKSFSSVGPHWFCGGSKACALIGRFLEAQLQSLSSLPCVTAYSDPLIFLRL